MTTVVDTLTLVRITVRPAALTSTRIIKSMTMMMSINVKERDEGRCTENTDTAGAWSGFVECNGTIDRRVIRDRRLHRAQISAFIRFNK